MPREVLLQNVRMRLSESPAVALLGARQVGKSTLAHEVAESEKLPVTFFDLESPAVREALSALPEKILSEQKGLVVIDEIQRLPQLFETLRPLCDRRKSKTVFLLLGSASWDLIKGVSETLAGRIQFVDVAGFSLKEVGAENAGKLRFRGGFPRAFLAKDDAAWLRWTESFARTFLERDIPGLASKTSPEKMGRFWKMLAHSHGQIRNAAQLADSMDLSVTAINHYMDLLVGSFMVRLLPPWFENLGKRLVKSPKIFLRDSGIFHYLLGLTSESDLLVHPKGGASWEGFALEQILIAHGSRDAYFYGTAAGAELDLLLLRNGRRWGFEFKCTDKPGTTKSMHVALKDLKLEHLFVVYPGSVRFPLDERITALPLPEVFGLSLKKSLAGT